MLSYSLGDEASYAFALSRQQLTVHRLPPQREIAPRLEAYLDELRRPGSRPWRSFLRAAVELTDVLMAPLAERLAAHSRLVVVPDGPLHVLPFEALLGDVPGRPTSFRDVPFLVHRWTVSYAPSASVWSALRGQPPRSPSEVELAAFADPFSSSANGGSALPGGVERWLSSEGVPDLSPLSGSRREVASIGALFDPERVALFVGPEASESRLKRDPRVSRARFLHLATHGLVSDRLPILSGLALAREEGSAEDGLLQVYEIFELELDAELVVLSACRSALGREVRGEGLVGLVRALFYAGTPRVLASLWSVSDRSTAQLMEELYRGLMAPGAEPAAALRRAKLELLAAPATAHPYHWAAFVLSGS